MKKLRSKGLSRRYWVTACTGCRMRRGQDLSIIILGGQEESKDTAYLSGCDSNVVGSALLSSLSALPDSLAPRVNSAVVTECLRIRFVFQRHMSSSVARPARRAPVCDRLPMFGADRRPAEAARPRSPALPASVRAVPRGVCTGAAPWWLLRGHISVLLVLFSGRRCPQSSHLRGELRAGGVLFNLIARIHSFGSCSSPRSSIFINLPPLGSAL